MTDSISSRHGEDPKDLKTAEEALNLLIRKWKEQMFSGTGLPFDTRIAIAEVVQQQLRFQPAARRMSRGVIERINIHIATYATLLGQARESFGPNNLILTVTAQLVVDRITDQFVLIGMQERLDDMHRELRKKR